uniref:EGF-like domain-containing protein n=1 Tax=Macrostomum lignano TaxID=282301 RepID=A0A1I8GGZ4_9PLAT
MQRTVRFDAMTTKSMLLLLLLPLATRAAGFNCSLSNCGNSASCTEATGVCTCPTDRTVGLEGDRCEQVTLLAPASPTGLSSNNSMFVASVKIDLTGNASFKGGIPLGNSELATQVFLCSNGYVTFNSDFCTTRVDLLKNSWAPAFVAPFATSFDFRKSVGSFNSTSEVSYKLVGSVSGDAALQKIRSSVAELGNATSAIVFTWKLMSPPPLAKAQQISFQLILFTDLETVTAAVSLYSSTNTLRDYFDWLPTLIGSRAATNGAANLLADKRSSSMAASLKPMMFGNATATARLTVLYTGSTPNYRKLCLAEADRALQPGISSAVLGWCPRSFSQAAKDPRFSRVAGQPTSFNLILSKLPNATQITCSYDNSTGGLNPMSSYSNVTVNAGDMSIGGKLYEYCCDRVPNLCDKYYEKFATPTSVNYQAPSAAGLAMGSGELRSFDGQLSRFLFVGDFWLVKTASPLSVQVRLEDTNPRENRTAGITGVAVQFTGTVNVSTEFHWVQSNQQIMVNYLTYSGSSSSFNVASNGTPNAMVVPSTSDLSVYLDKEKYFNKTSGLLGLYDDNAANDIAFSNGTVSNVSTAMEDWKVAAADSLFRFPTTAPTAQASWSALYWSADWNQTQMVQAVFAGNGTTYAAANQTCAATQPVNSTAYQNCLMEFADCGAACATAYLDSLSTTAQSIADYTGCSSSMLQWDSAKTQISATEGTLYQVNLTTLLNGTAPSSAVFDKVSGPSDLTVNQNGSLVWASPSGANATAIVVSVSASTGCASLVQLSVRLTRTAGVSGVCANSVEDFSYLTSPAGASFRRDKIYLSACKCNANYYAANCSMATCQLDCHTCNSSVPTECSACPSNYAASEVTDTKLAVCSYVDRCSSSVCTGAPYKSCRSVDPALQTSDLLYQCVCAGGYDYPSSTNKTACLDIDECNLLGYCDTSQNRVCNNTEGSYICNCSSGYSLQPSSGQCVDINECSDNPTICQNGTCVNTPGSYYCNCASGFIASPAKTCVDVNECLNPGLSRCAQNCTNIPGSFSCSCFDGFSPMPTCPATANCTNPSACSYPSLCSNVSGADTCQCPPPQALNSDKKTCN